MAKKKKIIACAAPRICPVAIGLGCGVVGAIFMLFVTVWPIITEFFTGAGMGLMLQDLMADAIPFYDPGTWYYGFVGVIGGFIDWFIMGTLIAGIYNIFHCTCKIL